MSILTKFFGRTASEGAAFAIGAAVHQPLVPPIQFLSNEAWALNPTKPLSVGDLASGVASGQLARDWAAAEAELTGYNGTRFDRLVRVFDEGPGVERAYALWHRGILDAAGFRRALARESLEPEWIDALVAARETLLSPADLAAMRQQGYIGADRQHEEAAKQGVTAERADLMFEAAGLPPGYGELAQMLHRGIITPAEFVQAIREANTKVKYTDELLALTKPILSPIQAATLRLKGWITDAQANEIGALSGYDAEQMERLYLMQGRPMAPGQMYTAWAREAPSPGGGAFDKADFLRAIRQSDIRPEYGEALWAIRYAYPSLFQLRRLAEDGTLTRAELLDVLHKQRYEPTLAAKIVSGWLAGSTTGPKGLTAAELTSEYEGLYLTEAEYVADLQALGYSQGQASEKARVVDAKRVKTARDQVVSRARSEYVRHRIPRDAAAAALQREGVPGQAQALLLTEWDHERELTADAMTAAQIKKAYGHGLFDRATALVRIERLGYDAADANIYLDE